MSFIKREVSPPDIKEGEVVQAEILGIEWPVKGEYGDQIKIKAKLSNGYECAVWQKYYDHPSERSVLGGVLDTLMKTMKTEYVDVNQALTALKNYGFVYLKVSGFREWHEELYPKFKLVDGKLPPRQAELKA
jgi:hypothetical protein